MKNPETGKFEVKKVFKAYNFEVVGTGDTKEEAKADLKKQLEAYRIPGTDVPGYRGPRYRPALKASGYINSPGFQMELGEDGKPVYRYSADRKAQVFTVDRGLAETAKVSDQTNREEA
jgi:hypothetical protein